MHVGHLDGPRLVLLNKTCRLCLRCDTLIVDRDELERVMMAAGLSAAVKAQDYVVLGTIDRRTWRRGLAGGAQLAAIREHFSGLFPARPFRMRDRVLRLTPSARAA